MTLTRADRKKALHHVVTKILDPDHAYPDMKLFISKSISKDNLHFITYLTTTNEVTISQLDYIDDKNDVVPLEKVPKAIISNFLKYVRHLLREGDENNLQTSADWEKITVGYFYELRVSIINTSGPPLVNLTPASTVATTMAATPINQELITFQKGIKIDPTLLK